MNAPRLTLIALLSLPLPVAVAHNAGAAGLLLVVLVLNHLLHPRRLPA